MECYLCIEFQAFQLICTVKVLKTMYILNVTKPIIECVKCLSFRWKKKCCTKQILEGKCVWKIAWNVNYLFVVSFPLFNIVMYMTVNLRPSFYCKNSFTWHILWKQLCLDKCQHLQDQNYHREPQNLPSFEKIHRKTVQKRLPIPEISTAIHLSRPCCYLHWYNFSFFCLHSNFMMYPGKVSLNHFVLY